MSFEPQLIESKLETLDGNTFNGTFDVIRKNLQDLEETWEGYQNLNCYAICDDGIIRYELYGSALETPEEVSARTAESLTTKHGRYMLYLTLKDEFENDA